MKLFNGSKHHSLVRYKEKGVGRGKGLVPPLSEFDCEPDAAARYLVTFKGTVVPVGSEEHAKFLRDYGIASAAPAAKPKPKAVTKDVKEAIVV